jgi:hypothetical protein
LAGGNAHWPDCCFYQKKSLALAYFGITAVSWYGNDQGGVNYRDSEDIQGNVVKLVADGMGFLKRQLYKLQKGQDFKFPGYFRSTGNRFGRSVSQCNCPP